MQISYLIHSALVHYSGRNSIKIDRAILAIKIAKAISKGESIVVHEDTFVEIENESPRFVLSISQECRLPTDVVFYI